MVSDDKKALQLQVFNKVKWIVIYLLAILYLFSAFSNYQRSVDALTNIGINLVTFVIQSVLILSFPKMNIYVNILFQCLVMGVNFWCLNLSTAIIVGFVPFLIILDYNFDKYWLGDGVLLSIFLLIPVGFAAHVNATFFDFMIEVTIAIALGIVFAISQNLITEQTFLQHETERLLKEVKAAYDQVETASVMVERERISRDLHDSVIQQILGMLLNLQSIAKNLATKKDIDEAIQRINTLVTLSRDTVEQTRQLINDYKQDHEMPFEMRLQIIESTFHENYWI